MKRTKRVSRCFNCKQVVRLAGSFTAKLDEPELTNGRLVETIKLCRPCASKAGYKVKGYTDGKRTTSKSVKGTD